MQKTKKLGVTIIGAILAIMTLFGVFMFTGCELFGNSNNGTSSEFLEVGKVYKEERDSETTRSFKVESSSQIIVSFEGVIENPNDERWNPSYVTSVISFDYEKKENNGTFIAFGSGSFGMGIDNIIYYSFVITEISENSCIFDFRLLNGMPGDGFNSVFTKI